MKSHTKPNNPKKMASAKASVVPKVKQPKVVSKHVKVHSERPKPVLAAKRETLGPVNGSVSFTSTRWLINPGDVASFPWLSTMAGLYVKYRFRKLKYTFIPTGSGYAAANVSGRCVLSFDQNVLSPPLATLKAAETIQPNTIFVPYEEASVVVPKEYLKELYIRSVAYPASSDPKTYDVGVLSISVEGTPNSNLIGELYVDYEVELMQPQLSEIALAPACYNLCEVYSNTHTWGVSNTWWTIEFPNRKYFGGGSLPVAVESLTGLVLPAGNFVVFIKGRLSSTTAQLNTLHIRQKTPVVEDLYDESYSAFNGGTMTGTGMMTISCPEGTLISFEARTAFSSGTTTFIAKVVIMAV